MAYASVCDVAVRWSRELSDEEKALVGVRLEDVERLIRRRIPDLDEQIDLGKVDVEDLVQVEADAVLRLARNPEGYISETDGNYTYQLSKDLATGRLSITSDEWLILGVRRNRLTTLVPSLVLGDGITVLGESEVSR
jgi:hypothetical protein